jgi:hypothetical protein
MNWKNIAARRWPGFSILGNGRYAAVNPNGIVRLFSTRLEMIASGAPGQRVELAAESTAPRPRDIRCFESDRD